MARPLLRSTALLVLVSGLAIAPLALAHPSLVRSTPAADATVAPASQIELQFSEKVMPRATRIELSMDHGRMKMAMPTATQEISEDGHSLRVRFAAPLPAGRYALQWRAVGQDSHPITGSYRFAVK
ncbi:copper homeostasis periplasmic binding protein CopC [Stenotrophomonas maltophilia]|jgi:methionine-rich copper-binding protein CopC|uniref:copper homeostasis periplasmic binding protein CopC n=1 Tax=Stenotrophomonas TaxID=40323 RepID=UPI00201CCD7A|nr:MULTISPECIES: copper homeostasis periplasmic binding protein CopC [Stenotrophomonas]MBN5024325.1 copper homeostasis periplasmic binding protein CopC [Stenotrophomonas maltophilia]MDH1272219.1 copper homeostasis periplasmic binding protein CopC [Stenotrophomonas sp. GD03937]MDH1483471.1 copper homeostasis periplasmic binding protein CopC [Stenotrophomonas sp. GD03712]MDR2961842.1 copper homeostasis periplasmic binding protein CopC [Stenotrophomonas sp.]UQY96512.1 copper homeostasis periplasm